MEVLSASTMVPAFKQWLLESHVLKVAGRLVYRWGLPLRNQDPTLTSLTWHSPGGWLPQLWMGPLRSSLSDAKSSPGHGLLGPSNTGWPPVLKGLLFYFPCLPHIKDFDLESLSQACSQNVRGLHWKDDWICVLFSAQPQTVYMTLSKSLLLWYILVFLLKSEVLKEVTFKVAFSFAF